MYKRKCVNWLDTWTQWVKPRSEVKESMIRWGGLYTIACALRRRVWIPKSINGRGLLGGWECYPYLYIMFVGPPGMRKTVTLDYSLELFEALPLTAAPNACSQAALSQRLLESSDTSVYIVASEFSDLLLKSGPEMYEFLTSAFDGRRKFETSTISRGIEFIEKPCINMAAGTTPKWIAENMPESAIGGGFASRVIFIYESVLRRKRLFYRDYDYTAGESLKTNLIDDLLHMSTMLEGAFSISDGTMDWLEDWYQKHEPSKAHPKIQGYMNRKHVHLFKAAMLYHISYSDDLVLTQSDLEWGLSALEEIEPNLPSVFEGIGRNPYTLDSRHIAMFIKEKGKISKKEILAQFQSVATPNILLELLVNLSSMGVIRTELIDNELIYVSLL